MNLRDKINEILESNPNMVVYISKTLLELKPELLTLLKPGIVMIARKP